MTTRTQVTIEAGLRRRAGARAAALGISFAEYVRRVLSNDLGESRNAADVSALFDLVTDGSASDIARDKERMIGEATWQARRSGKRAGQAKVRKARARPR